MAMVFQWPVTNGLLEVMERIEASAQLALQPHRHDYPQPQNPQQKNLAAAAAAAAAGSAEAAAGGGADGVHWWRRCCCWLFRHLQREQQWAQPLLGLLLAAPGVQVLQQLVMSEAPALFKSVTWQRQHKDQKSDRGEAIICRTTSSGGRGDHHSVAGPATEMFLMAPTCRSVNGVPLTGASQVEG
jgi:hypothetical protein